ncbi:MAG: hypothetical protein FWC32_04445, partial [Firmicutes bacterium]|nr:hypothetical protein [Bacillota bacterium]
MPIINSGKMIEEVRRRKDQQKQVQAQLGADTELFVTNDKRRTVSGKHVPKPQSRDALREFTLLRRDDLLCTHLENQPLGVYALRSRLLFLLEIGCEHAGQELLDEFRRLDGFTSDINLQFILSQEASFMNLTNCPPGEIIPIIHEALRITWPQFDESNIGNNSLLYEEPRLLHTLALVRAREDDCNSAIKLLRYVKSDLQTHQPDDLEYNNLLNNTLFSLAQCHLQAKNYKAAIKACIEGIKSSVMRMHGKLVPEFCYIMALAYKGLGKLKKCKPLLQLAFFGQVLLEKIPEAREILTSAKEDFGITFETYGAETPESPQYPKTEYKLGEPNDYQTLREMVQGLRNNAGLTLRLLSEGLCPYATLNKFENGQVAETKLYYLEPILQRLGRGIDPYCNVFLSMQAFNARILREEISKLLVVKQWDTAEEKLNILRKEKGYKKYANRQFVLAATATIYLYRHGYDETYYKKIVEALKVTWKNFDENTMSNRPLTRYEVILLNQLGNYYKETKSLDRANNIFSQLFRQQNIQYADESQKALSYGTIAVNYSGCLNDQEWWNKAIEVAEQGISFECSHDRLLKLPALHLNKAYAMYN